MNCRIVRRHIDAYIDGEVDPSTQIDFERHLASCAHCQERVAFALAVKSQVRETVQATRAPDGLRKRIHVALDDVERPNASPWVRVLPMKKRYAIPLAAAAAVLMLATWTRSSLDSNAVPGVTRAPTLASTATGVQPPALLEDVVRVHSAELPADVKGEQPQHVTRYFRNKVRFPVRPAQFQRSDARLVGARLSNVRDRSAAALYYDVGGQRMTVVVFEQPEPLHPHVRRARLLGQEVMYRNVNGHVVPVREQDGLTYAFTGDLDRRALLRLAATAQVRW